MLFYGLRVLLHGLRVLIQVLLDPLEGTVDQALAFPYFANKLVEVFNDYGKVVLACFSKDLVPFGLFSKAVNLPSKVGDALLSGGALDCQTLDLVCELSNFL